MRTREAALAPTPDRAPYFRVHVGDQSVMLRTPSVHRLGKILQRVGKERAGRVEAVIQMVARGESVVSVVTAAPDVLEVLAGMVGVAWVDPILELEATEGDDFGTYGAAVFEELHEAGWKLQDTMIAGLTLAQQVIQDSQIDKLAAERASFFLRPLGRSSANASSPSASSSEPTSGALSET